MSEKKKMQRSSLEIITDIAGATTDDPDIASQLSGGKSVTSNDEDQKEDSSSSQ